MCIAISLGLICCYFQSVTYIRAMGVCIINENILSSYLYLINLFGNFIQLTFITNHFKAGTNLASLVTNLQTNIESAQVRFVKTWPLHQE